MKAARSVVGRAAAGAALVASAVLLSGCHAPLIKPAELTVPLQASCFTLSEPLEGVQIRGLMKFVWTLRLERGPYIAVHEDANGTYFRAPPGGIYRWIPQGKAAGFANLENMTFDGGVYVPRDPARPVNTYIYMSTVSVPPVVPAPDLTCGSAAIVRDPVTKGVKVASYAAVGAAAGIAGAYNSGVGYGKAAGVGVAGGAIGMALVSTIINMDVGKIEQFEVHPDAAFTAKLTKAAREAAPIKENTVAAAPK